MADTEHPLLFYGRRAGRKLRVTRAAALNELLPRYEIILPAGELDPQTLFPSQRDIWLEIGFGNGEHLLAQAQAHPEIGCIGCEPFRPGVSMLAQATAEAGIQNLRIFPDDARRLLDKLASVSISRCFILFADPWPKTRHAFRRFINPDNLTRFARVLRPDGELRLATDDPGLAEWYEEQFSQGLFELTRFEERPTDWPPTRYEEKALLADRQPRYYAACLKPNPCIAPKTFV